MRKLITNNYYLLITLVVTGCVGGGGSAGPKWWKPFDGGKITPEQIEVHRTFDAFAPYHFLALAMFAAGWVMIVWSAKKTGAGIMTVLFSMGLSLWAFYVPTHGWIVTAVLAIGAITAVGYLLYKERIPSLKDFVREKADKIGE